MPSLMERFKDSVADAVAYKTVKLVKTYDKTLIMMHLFFMSCITIFTFFSMIVSHNYMKFEVPRTVVTTKMESSDYAAAAGGSFADLGYCADTPGGNEFVDIVTWGGQTFADPQCVDHLIAPEFTKVGVQDVWLNTHFRQTAVTRTCLNANNNSFVAGGDCVTTETLVNDAFIARPELLKLVFYVNVETSFGMRAKPDELTVNFPSGRVVKHRPSSDGSALELTYGEILELAGIELNATSPTATGKGAVYLEKRAPHRLMGSKLRLVFTTTNVNPDPWRPFDTTLRTEVTVKHDTTSERMGPGTEVIYTGSLTPAAETPGATLHTHDESFITRDWAGTYIEYQSEGDVGEVDLITTINAVTNAFVLIGMATFVVDFIGQLISSSFYDDKYEDDGERLILEDIAEHLENPSHPSVPFDPKNLRLVNDDDQPGMSYENAIYDLQSELADVRDQLSLIPEEEADFVEGSAPGRLPDHGYPGLLLVEEFSEQHIIAYKEANAGAEPAPAIVPLHPGAQMLGRGVGNVLSKAVSRQQFTMTVVRDKVRMKALREGPGYMRDSARDGSLRFDALRATKSVVLTVGDRVCFRLREGKMGGHLGIYRIDTEAPPVKSWFSFMGC